MKDELKTFYAVYKEDGHYWRTPVEAKNKKEAKKKIRADHPTVKRVQFF